MRVKGAIDQWCGSSQGMPSFAVSSGFQFMTTVVQALVFANFIPPAHVVSYSYETHGGFAYVSLKDSPVSSEGGMPLLTDSGDPVFPFLLTPIGTPPSCPGDSLSVEFSKVTPRFALVGLFLTH